MQDKKLDVVDSFCYLGDTIGAGGGCDLSVITRIRSAWGKFRGTLANINLTCPFIHHTWASIQHVYPHCPCCMPVSVGPPNVNDLLKLQRNDRAMIRWDM